MVDFDREQIIQLTQNVWSATLSIQLVPAASTCFDITERRGSFVSACVQIGGAWTGAVRLDCTLGLARQTAAAFMGKDSELVLREELLDSLGEVTNMVAGSIKPLLPRPCHISLPSIVDGEDYEFNIRKVRLRLGCDFYRDADFLKVSLFEAIVPAEANAGIAIAR